MSQQESGKTFKVFFLVWFGQFVSLVGSGLTRFALGVWVYQQTGSITKFAVISVFAFLPGILVAPFAGVWVDRWDRRKVMLFSDLGAGLCTLAAALLFWSGSLQVWHIWLIAGAGAVAESFQWPAYAAATSLLVPKRHLGRANGMIEFGHSASLIMAPVLAGFLMVGLGLAGIMVIDFVTFLVAITTLAMVRFPKPKPSTEGAGAGGSVVKAALAGWRYITTRKGLLMLLFFFAALNFFNSFTIVLTTPLVLEFAGADALGTVLAVGGAGMLAGSLLMIAWGGPEPKIYGVLLFSLVLAAGFSLHGLSPSIPLICAGSFLAAFCLPIINGSSQTIWQSKIAPDMQGRVFALRRMFAWSTNPLAFLLAGPIAESLFEPLMAAGGSLAPVFGPWIGTGPGRGIALLFLIVAVAMGLLALGGLVYRPLRRVEQEVPEALTAEAEGELAPA